MYAFAVSIKRHLHQQNTSLPALTAVAASVLGLTRLLELDEAACSSQHQPSLPHTPASHSGTVI